MIVIRFNTAIKCPNVLNEPTLLAVFWQFFKKWMNLCSPTCSQAATTIYLTLGGGKGVIVLSSSVLYGFNSDY